MLRAEMVEVVDGWSGEVAAALGRYERQPADRRAANLHVYGHLVTTQAYLLDLLTELQHGERGRIQMEGVTP